MTGTPKEPQLSPPASDASDETIDLGDLLGIAVENRWLIVAIMLVSLLVGGFKAQTAVPIYRADGLLQVEENKSSGLSSLDVTAMLKDYTPVIGEIEILQSRSVLGDVVDNLQLDIHADPEYMPYIGEALARRMPADERPKIKIDTLDVPHSWRGTWMKLVIDDINLYSVYDSKTESLLFQGTVGEVATYDTGAGDRLSLFVSALQGEEGQVFLIARGSRIGAIRSLQGRLSVKEKSEWSGILSIEVQGPDPDAVTEQVDEIAKVYVRQNVERRSEEAERTLAFLNEQLPDVKQTMIEAELNLNEYRLEKGSVDLPLETQTVLQTIVSVEAQINALRQEREKVTLAFTELHPTVVALDRQIGRLNTELVALNDQVRELPATQQELLGLIRDVEVNTALYTSLLDTQQELQVVKAGTIGNVRVIDYAVRPGSPFKPNKSRMMMFALVVGGILGFVAAFARKALRSGVEDPDLIEKHVNVPVYATVAHSNRQDQIFKDLKSQKAKRAILAMDKPDDPAIESIRNLRTALHFGMMDVENNCIMISGPSPEVGKSFISVNLAAVLASNDRNVLLIDGDLRRGHLHEYLGIERENGLSNYITGDMPVADVMHETSVPGLTLIPTGTLPPNPAELLLHERFANCLQALMEKFDHIIIDSPPILAVTDATIIGQLAGGTLLVLKAAEHPMREIELSVKRLKQANVNLRGILFNDIRTQSRSYGVGKYNYQYTYKKA